MRRATASLGAVWSSAAPEFGVKSVLDRFQQIEPTVLLACDGYLYGGKRFERLHSLVRVATRLLRLAAQLPVTQERGGGEPGEEHQAQRIGGDDEAQMVGGKIHQRPPASAM